MTRCRNCDNEFALKTTFCPNCGFDNSGAGTAVHVLYPLACAAAGIITFVGGVLAEFLTAVFIGGMISNISPSSNGGYIGGWAGAVAYIVEFVVLLAASMYAVRSEQFQALPMIAKSSVWGFLLGYLGFLGVCQLFTIGALVAQH